MVIGGATQTYPKPLIVMYKDAVELFYRNVAIVI